MSKFWNSNTLTLKPYVPGEQPKDKTTFIKLNTNENPYPPSPFVMERIKNFNLGDLRLYPNPEGAKIKGAVSEYYGVSYDEVFVGNGSDEVLALLFKAFFDNNTLIAFPDVTYSFYPVYCSLYGIPYTEVPVNEDFSIDLSSYPKEARGIIFANPNAPTGLYIKVEDIERLLKDRPDTLIIVDEAYVDFGAQSCVPLIKKYDNLLVVQTLSKSRSLAGLRIGFAIGNKDLIEGINRVKNSFNSYPLDTIAQIAAEAAIKDRDCFESVKAKIMKTRDWTMESLKVLGVEVTPSLTNFIFARIPGIPGPIAQVRLKQEGILVRNFNSPRISDWIRITVGTDEDMKAVVEAIKRIMTENA